MVPAFRLGLGWLLVNQVAGYIMVLETRGRQSGQRRYAPVNYALLGGHIYCLAGWGRGTHWFANLRDDPYVIAHLPGSRVIGGAVEVTDPAEARQARVAVARNAGFALLFDGLNPRGMKPEDS